MPASRKAQGPDLREELDRTYRYLDQYAKDNEVLRDKLEAVQAALFPPDTHFKGGFIIYDADENLDSALYDLRRHKADSVCIGTLERIYKQLREARRILGK